MMVCSSLHMRTSGTVCLISSSVRSVWLANAVALSMTLVSEMQCPDCGSEKVEEVMSLPFDGCIYHEQILLQCRDCEKIWRELC